MYKKEFEQAKEISVEEYINLIDPIFIGQSRADENNMYWTLWKVGSENSYEYYKIHNTL